ncbi:hypothetical protein PV10_08951 [Exophiala mesophila]|uniref:Uncharacterized protein n=1 Tax=Exophiala mesophila TaxID=212818 RepID=A0A0D1ZRH6_EXOME|nr:uncharacterized protein PV10_08951 [Exophiala mesophila]KIV89378.1 hypothetical protein PV10_08951 [Exophiala mesophila]
MSNPNDPREGLSPSPPNILDLFDEDGDSDVDFAPATDEDHSTQASDSNTEYTDAPEDLAGIQIIFQDAADGDTDQDEQDGNTTETEQTTLTYADLQTLFGTNNPLRQLLQGYRAIARPSARYARDDDSDEWLGNPRRNPRRRRTIPGPDRWPKVPNEHGQHLMKTGIYGSKDHHVDIHRKRRKNVSERLMWRRLGVDARSSFRRQNNLIAQDMVPNNTTADKIIHYDSRAYCGQYSDDGNFFFSCTQNFKVRMYDTSNPYEWQYYKTVDYPFGQWTITDATLSPDNRFLAYSSIRHAVCLATTDPNDDNDHTILDFTNFAPGSAMGSQNYGYMGRHGFGIWSLRFSGDGREIVAGTSDHSVVVYDLDRRQSIVRLSNHDDDVNAVCFGDKLSPHILYSGSDDQTLRVWDRRSMADGRPAGIFVGHTEGLTYVDSKGDGRYVLSNGKDQTMKLWDLRKMLSPNEVESINLHKYTTNFDYRFSQYHDDDFVPNPHDCSVVTFRGHSVLRTLIRCHFSPPGSSNSRYVYSGSEDGRVWIWNMDGTVKGKIDVAKSTENSRPMTGAQNDVYGYEMTGRSSSSWSTCVRDASWSPSAPIMAATSWNGYGSSTGTVSLHSWTDGAADDDGDPPMGLSYNARLDRREDSKSGRRPTHDTRLQRMGQGSLRARGARDDGVGRLRSRVVRPNRFGEANVQSDDDDDTPGLPGQW